MLGDPAGLTEPTEEGRDVHRQKGKLMYNAGAGVLVGDQGYCLDREQGGLRGGARGRRLEPA